MKPLLFVLLLIINAQLSSPLLCKIGMGQRGKNYENGIGWTRECPRAKYCFEAVTLDSEKASRLFEYPWDSYYEQFYVRACGGDYGTNYTWHPYKLLPKATRHQLGMVKLNVTTPKLITGQGGPENRVEMMLGYKCKVDLCEKRIYKNAAPGRVSVTTAHLALTLAIVAALSLSSHIK